MLIPYQKETMVFKPSKLYDEMTIVMVCRNWASLYYPFIEAIWSTIPLGCRYLIGIFDTTDDTMDYLNIINQHVPIEYYHGTWRYQNKLGAIGVATHETWQQATTTARFNLQGNEVLLDDGPEKIFAYFDEYWPSPVDQKVHGGLLFRHFWGDFYFEGCKAGGAYNFARRIGNARDDYIHGSGDGCYPNPPHTQPTGATIHRYSYCFDNQIEAKQHNHSKIIDGRDAEYHIAGCKSLRNRPNYDGDHPSYVEHLKDKRNYDINASLQVFLAAINNV